MPRRGAGVCLNRQRWCRVDVGLAGRVRSLVVCAEVCCELCPVRGGGALEKLIGKVA